ncbi:MAG: hypothetical protein PF505_02440 [Vallitaleaceae bacterium]|jgi:hypothetical protein|nr:hypothetical protein [Vallitaleaceae bacterium]
MAKSEDCVLLPEGTRNKHIWAAARRKKSRSYGFGQANVWYANEETAKCYVDKMVENIEDYDGEKWDFDSPIYEG